MADNTSIMTRRKQKAPRNDSGPRNNEAAAPVRAAAVSTPGAEQPPVELPGLWHNVWLRRVVTVLLLLHLTAVVIAPLAVAPQSALAGSIWNVFQPYLEAAYLNHGYHFFAPEPGPSHLIRFVARRADGTTVTGEFPNKQDEWPRLLYHRYFMLTEFVNGMWFSERPKEKDIANRYVRSYAHHLMTKYDADEVDLYLREHRVPLPQNVAKGMRLDDASLYEEKSLGTFKRNEL